MSKSGVSSWARRWMSARKESITTLPPSSGPAALLFASISSSWATRSSLCMAPLAPSSSCRRRSIASWVLTRARTSSAWNGLVIKSTAPRSNPSTFLLTCSTAVRKMTMMSLV